MAEVRRRKQDEAVEENAVDSKQESKRIADLSAAEASNRISVLDVLRILGGILLVNCALSYYITGHSVAWGYRPWFSRPAQLRSWAVRQ